MKTYKPLLDKIERFFGEKLSRKTGWGKNEVMQAYKDSVIQALMEIAIEVLESNKNQS